MSKHNNKKQNTFQVYGYNNCLSLLKEADCKIISIQILEEKKSVFSQKIDFQRHSKLIHFLSKKDFYKKFDNIRSQGIVIYFEGPIICSGLTHSSNSSLVKYLASSPRVS